MGFLPPVIMELRANGAQAIAEMGKVAAAAKSTAAQVQAAAEKEAATTKAAAAAAKQAADQQVLAAQTAAKAQAEAAARTAEAQAKATAATEKAAQMQADAVGVMTEKQQAAYDRQILAVNRAAATAETAAAKEVQAAARAADASVLAAEKQVAAGKLQEEAALKAAAAQEAAATRSSTALSAIGGIANKISLGAIAGAAVIGGVSLEMASKFEKSTMLLVTAGGEAKNQLASVQAGILNIAEKTGTSTEQLSEGMYVMEKAGYRGADGLNVLKAAAEGAKAENVDLATMTQAVTDVLLDYGLKASSAVSVTNEMVAASGAAKTTMQDFASSMAAVIPIGSAVGLSFEQLGGAIATMTQHGETAQQSSQNLANLIQQLQKPSNIASAAMQQIGIDAVGLSKNLGTNGLSGTLRTLSDAVTGSMKDGMVVQDTMKKSATATADLQKMIATMPPELAKMSNGLLDGSTDISGYTKAAKGLGGQAGATGVQFLSLYKASQGVNDAIKGGQPAFVTYNAEMTKLTGGITGFKTATMLMMYDQAQFTANIKAIGDAGQKTGQDIATWADTQSTLSVQMDQAKQMVGNLGIEIGSKLVPVAKDMVKGFSDVFHGFEQGNPILLTAVGIIGGALTISTVNFTIAMVKAGIKSVSTMIDLGAAAISQSLSFIRGFTASGVAVSEFGGKAELAGVKTRTAMSGMVSSVGLTAIGIAAGFAAMSAAEAAWQTHNPTPTVDDATKALSNYSDTASSVGKIQMDQMFNSLNRGVGQDTIQINSLADAVQQFNNQDFLTAAKNFTNGADQIVGGPAGQMDQISNRVKTLGDALGTMVKGGSLTTAAKGFDQLATIWVKSGKSAQDALEHMPAYKQALIDQAAAVGQNLSPQELLEFAMGKVPKVMLDAMTSTQKYTDANGQVKPITPDLQKSLAAAGVSAEGLATDLGKVLDGMLATGQATEDSRTATSNYSKTLGDATTAVADLVKAGTDVGNALNANATDFNLTDAAGSALNEKFQSVKDKGLALAKSLAGPGVDAQKNVQDALGTTYKNMITAADGMGIHGQAAIDLTRKLLGIPPNVNVDTWMSDAARAEADKLKAAADLIPKTIKIGINITRTFQTDGVPFPAPNSAQNVAAAGGTFADTLPTFPGHAAGGLMGASSGLHLALSSVGGYPGGGLLNGPGTGTSDSMIARVSSGEFIVRAAAVNKYGAGYLDQLNRGVLAPAGGSAKSYGSATGGTSHMTSYSNQSTTATSNTGGGSVTNNVTVNAQTNADPHRLAAELGYQLRLMA